MEDADVQKNESADHQDGYIAELIRQAFNEDEKVFAVEYADIIKQVVSQSLTIVEEQTQE